MKKTVPFLLAALLCLAMPGCSHHAADTIEEPSAETKEPIWAQGTETDCQLFQGLNLDGVGDADDEAYVSTFQYGDYEEKITVLRIHLGTGETLANVFPIYGWLNFSTGTLFSEERDAIVLEVADRNSTYGAASLFVLDIHPAGESPTPGSTVRMDTTKGIRLNSGADLPNSYCTDFTGSTAITANTGIVDIAGSPLQGLEVHAVGDIADGQKEDLSQIFCWIGGNSRADDGWELLENMQ